MAPHPRAALEALRYALLAFRTASGLTQTAIAKEIGLSQPSYAAYENGDRVMSVAQLTTTLVAVDKLHMRGSMTQLRDAADKAPKLPHEKNRQWEKETSCGSPLCAPTHNPKQPPELICGLEYGATSIVLSTHMLIPELLQTESYARYFLRQTAQQRPKLNVDAEWELLASRHAVLDAGGTTGQPPHLTTYIHRSALRRWPGKPATMVEQLRHLLEAAERPEVDLCVYPAIDDDYYHPSESTTVELVSWNNDLSITHSVNNFSSLYHGCEPCVTGDRRILTHIGTVATSSARSTQIIRDVIYEFRHA